MTLSTFADACAWAAVMHAGQRRKGPDAEPYVNHVLDVARRAAAGSADPETITAAVLHDVVEDTTGTRADIAARYGERVAALVMEVTDDKGLAWEERKRLQVERAPGRSDGAKRIKLADLASNMAAMAHAAPVEWDAARCARYVAWGEAVADGCRGVDAVLEAAFDEAAAKARAAYPG